MTTLEVTLPDNLAREAGEIGLLTSAAIEAMLREALRQRRVNRLFTAMDAAAQAGLAPMTMEEIQAEVNAVRAERRANAAGR